MRVKIDSHSKEHGMLRLYDEESEWAIGRFSRKAIKQVDDNILCMHLPCGDMGNLLHAQANGCSCGSKLPEELVRKIKFIAEIDDL